VLYKQALLHGFVTLCLSKSADFPNSDSYPLRKRGVAFSAHAGVQIHRRAACPAKPESDDHFLLSIVRVTRIRACCSPLTNPARTTRRSCGYRCLICWWRSHWQAAAGVASHLPERTTSFAGLTADEPRASSRARRFALYLCRDHTRRGRCNLPSPTVMKPQRAPTGTTFAQFHRFCSVCFSDNRLSVHP
jgi:hypothetical protein